MPSVGQKCNQNGPFQDLRQPLPSSPPGQIPTHCLWPSSVRSLESAAAQRVRSPSPSLPRRPPRHGANLHSASSTDPVRSFWWLSSASHSPDSSARRNRHQTLSSRRPRPAQLFPDHLFHCHRLKRRPRRRHFLRRADRLGHRARRPRSLRPRPLLPPHRRCPTARSSRPRVRSCI